MSARTISSPSVTRPRRSKPIRRAGDAPPPERASRVLLVGSSGGHLDHLVRLEPWWRDLERHWVTFDLPDARSRLEGEPVTWAHHPTTRNLKNLVRNFFVARRVLRDQRPDLVVSTGAGVAFPFFVLAAVHRIRTIYLEVYDRVDSPTMTGRLCRPLATRFLVQWPAQQAFYRGSECIGSIYP